MDRRTNQILSELQHDIFNKYKYQLTKKIDTFYEERQELKKLGHKELADLKLMNEIEEETDETITAKIEKETEDEIERLIKRGIIPRPTKKELIELNILHE